jgi:hypothetical protein
MLKLLEFFAQTCPCCQRNKKSILKEYRKERHRETISDKGGIPILIRGIPWQQGLVSSAELTNPTMYLHLLV